MRGRVLLYSLLLILLVYLTCGVGAVTCGANSIVSKTNDTCICNSGYIGTNCGLAGASCTPLVADPVVIDFKPSLTNGTGGFMSNTLSTSISSPYVSGRRFSSIELVNSTSAKCSMGSADSYWERSFIPGKCQDRFEINMPWIAHRSCGFSLSQERTTDSVWAFVARISMAYQDNLGMVADVPMLRTVTSSFVVYVVMPKFIEISITNIQVISEVDIEVVFLDNPYDPETSEMTLQFMTMTNWPNKLLGPVHLIPPPGINVSRAGVDPSEPACSNAFGTSCNQSLEFTLMITNKNLCYFDGEYKANFTVITCRNSNDCTKKPVILILELVSGSVCTPGRPNVNSTITAFSAKEFNDPSKATTTASLDNPMWFLTDLAADEITTITRRTFMDITYDDGQGGGRQYLMRTTEMTDRGGKVGLELAPDATWFSYTWTRSVFSVGPTGQRPHKVAAVIQLEYNVSVANSSDAVLNGGEKRKRMFYMVWDMGTQELKRGSISSNLTINLVGKDDAVTEEGKGKRMSTSSLVGAVVGAAVGAALIASIAVVAARRKRRQTRHLEIAAAVAAASAAAFAAAEAASFAEQADRPPTPPPTVSPILDFNRV